MAELIHGIDADVVPLLATLALLAVPVSAETGTMAANTTIQTRSPSPHG